MGVREKVLLMKGVIQGMVLHFLICVTLVGNLTWVQGVDVCS